MTVGREQDPQTAEPTSEEYETALAAALETAGVTNEFKPRALAFDAHRHKMLLDEFRHLYTAITRARVNVWMFEEDAEKRAPMFDFFIRRGLASLDPRCSGLVSEKDFKKVLYLEGGISYSEIALIIEEAPRKGGFVGYDAWIVDYLNLYQPADSSFRTQGQPTAHPGQPWEEGFADALFTSHIFVPVLSKDGLGDCCSTYIM